MRSEYEAQTATCTYYYYCNIFLALTSAHLEIILLSSFALTVSSKCQMMSSSDLDTCGIGYVTPEDICSTLQCESKVFPGTYYSFPRLENLGFSCFRLRYAFLPVRLSSFQEPVCLKWCLLLSILSVVFSNTRQCKKKRETMATCFI